MLTIQFHDNNIKKKQKQIKRFKIYWKASIKCQIQKTWYQSNNTGLYLMFEFLDYPAPIIRNQVKMWLEENVDEFDFILEPILSVLTMPQASEMDIKSQCLLYKEVFETKTIFQSYNILRNLLIHLKSFFINYIQNKMIGQKLKQTIFIQNDDDSYLTTIVQICLKCLQGKESPQLEQSFKNDIVSIKSCCCEFLETLCENLEININKVNVLQQVIDIYEPLLIIMNNEIENLDQGMELQFLNIFKIILRKNEILEFFQIEIVKNVTHNMLIPIIIKGLNNPSAYVQNQLINFFTASFPVFTSLYPENILQPQLQQILIQFMNILSQINKVQKNQDENLNDNKLSFLTGLQKIFLFYLKHQEKSTLLQLKNLVGLNENTTSIFQQFVQKNLFDIIKCLDDSFEYRIDYKISLIGMNYKQIEKLKNTEKKEEDIIQPITINSKIIELIKILDSYLPNHIFDEQIGIWIEGSQNENLVLIFIQIELLTAQNLTMVQLIQNFINSKYTKQLQQFYLENNYKTKNLILNFGNLFTKDMAKIEVNLLYFFFCVLSRIQFKKMEQKELQETWAQFIIFTKIFQDFPNFNTQLWLIEIFHHFSNRFSPQSLIYNYFFKNEFQIIILKAIEQQCMVLTKQVVYQFQSAEYRNYYPLIPSFFEIETELQIVKTEDDVNFQIRCIIIIGSRSQFSLIKYFIHKFKITPTIMHLFNIITNLFKQRSPQNFKFVQFCSKLVLNFLELQCKNLNEQLYPIIQNIFQSNVNNQLKDFFTCDLETLQIWKKIYLRAFKIEFITNLIQKLKDNNDLGTFIRICFIMLTGQIYNESDIDEYKTINDDFLMVLKQLMGNLNLIDKKYQILVIFCVKVFIQKTSQNQMVYCFCDFWPSLINYLIYVFKEKLEDINLLFYSLKLIEILNIKQMKQFQIYQWIFIFDSIGVSNLEKQQYQNLNYCHDVIDFIQPLILNLFDNQINFNYIKVQSEDNINQESKQTLILSQPSVFYLISVTTFKNQGINPMSYCKKSQCKTRSIYLNKMKMKMILTCRNYNLFQIQFLKTEIYNYLMSLFQYFQFSREQKAKKRFNQFQKVQNAVQPISAKSRPQSALANKNKVKKQNEVKFQDDQETKDSFVKAPWRLQKGKNRMAELDEDQEGIYLGDNMVGTYLKVYQNDAVCQTDFEHMAYQPKESYASTAKKYNGFYQPNYKDHLVTEYRKEFLPQESFNLVTKNNLGQSTYEKNKVSVYKYEAKKVRTDAENYYKRTRFP